MIWSMPIFHFLQHIVEGLYVDKEKVERNVQRDLPFLALEKAMMWLTEEGADRQEAHEKIREVAMAAREAQKREKINLEIVLADVFFDKVCEFVVLAEGFQKFSKHRWHH